MYPVPVTWIVRARTKSCDAVPAIDRSTLRYAAAIKPAARARIDGSTVRYGAVIGPTGDERRTNSGCNGARCDGNATAHNRSSAAANKSSASHSAAVTYSASGSCSAADVAATASDSGASVAHSATDSHSVAALGESVIRKEDRKRENCTTYDQRPHLIELLSTGIIL